MIVGLTGGIGSGKSTVSQYFRELGIQVINADDITDQLLASNQTVINAIVQHFGPQVLASKGTLNRAWLRSLIFESLEERQWLEKLLHPLIKTEVLQGASHSNSKYTVIEIPLLIEANFQDTVDRILVVDCNEKQQIERVYKRDGIPTDTIQAIIRTQADRKQRLAYADDIIENNEDKTVLRHKVLTLHDYYQKSCH